MRVVIGLDKLRSGAVVGAGGERAPKAPYPGAMIGLPRKPLKATEHKGRGLTNITQLPACGPVESQGMWSAHFIISQISTFSVIHIHASAGKRVFFSKRVILCSLRRGCPWHHRRRGAEAESRKTKYPKSLTSRQAHRNPTPACFAAASLDRHMPPTVPGVTCGSAASLTTSNAMPTRAALPCRTTGPVGIDHTIALRSP